MEPAEHSPDVESLLAQSGWARRLALRLLGDAELADDVVQDALVAALERPPRGPGLREWLGVVVRNLALRRRRREARRSDVERRAARPEAVGGGEAALERLQLQRRLAEIVLALDEPYRTAVVLRHIEGLTARQIAARQRCSEEAARQRVTRGLARLRAELDRQSGGDRGAWCGAFALLYGAARDGNLVPTALSGAGASWIGGTLLGAKTTLAVAVGLTLGGVAWLVRDGAGTGQPARPAAVRAIAPSATDARGAANAPEVRAASEPSAARGAVVAPTVAASSDGTLRGRVLDERGAPLAGAEVLLLEAEGDATRLSTSSDAAGSFAFAALDGTAHAADREWRLRAQFEGRVPFEGRRVGPDLGELVLVERPRITGVLLGPDGAPVAPPGRVQFDVLRPDGEIENCYCEVDSQGRFATDELVPGRLVASHARARGCGPRNERYELELAPGARHELTLSVPAGATVHGVVVDADTEAPVPFAEVWADGWTYAADSIEPSTIADAEGRFELRGAEVGHVEADFDTAELVSVRVAARAAGYLGRPFEGSVIGRGEDGRYSPLVLRITRADASIAGRLVWPDGTPAADISLFGLDDGPNFHFEATDRDGRFAFEGLPPGPFALCARTAFEPGTTDQPQGRVDARVELAAGARETLELVLAPADGVIRGRVVDGDGRPLAGVAIEAGEHMLAGGLTMGLGHRQTVSDADGRYALEALGPGRYQVEVAGSERRVRAARPPHVQVDLAPDQPREDVDFELVPAVAWAGWIDVGEDDPELYEVARLPLGGGEALERTQPDADGRFRFEGCWPEPCVIALLRDGVELARVEVGAAGGDGLVLAAPR